ncbi:MAG: 50S ribosomal protein L10 [Frankiaceae bacterium]
MANAEKTAAVAEITEAFRDSSAAVLTEYRGLTVAQLKELRRTLSGNATYAVVKNTLTKIAMRDAGLPDLTDRLTGPTAIAFVQGDPVEVAKGLRDFGRIYPLLVVKGGILDGRPLSAEEVRTLADLESREVLLSRMAGALTASLSRAAALFNAPLAQVARLAAALVTKATEDPSVLAAPVPLPDTPAESGSEEPAAEATGAPAAESVSEEPAALTPAEPETAPDTQPEATDAGV